MIRRQGNFHHGIQAGSAVAALLAKVNDPSADQRLDIERSAEDLDATFQQRGRAGLLERGLGSQFVPEFDHSIHRKAPGGGARAAFRLLDKQPARGLDSLGHGSGRPAEFCDRLVVIALQHDPQRVLVRPPQGDFRAGRGFEQSAEAHQRIGAGPSGGGGSVGRGPARGADGRNGQRGFPRRP